MSLVDHRYLHNQVFREDEVINELSLPLQRAIALHNARNVINSVPLFHDARMVRVLV